MKVYERTIFRYIDTLELAGFKEKDFLVACFFDRYLSKVLPIIKLSDNIGQKWQIFATFEKYTQITYLKPT